MSRQLNLRNAWIAIVLLVGALAPSARWTRGQDAPPEAPRSVLVTWSPIDDSRLQRYRVEYRAQGAEEAETLDTNETSVLVQGLAPSTVYRFSVFAVNRYGLESPPVPDIVMVTQPIARPSDAGDLDDDGDLTICDVVAFQNRPAQLDHWPSWRRTRADMNLDGVLDDLDFEGLIHAVLGGPNADGFRSSEESP